MPTLADHIVSAPPGGQLNASRTPISHLLPPPPLSVSLCSLWHIRRVTQPQREREHHTLFANTWVVLCSVLKSPAPPPPHDCLHVWRGISYPPQHQCGLCEAEGCVQGLTLGWGDKDGCRQVQGGEWAFLSKPFFFFLHYYYSYPHMQLPAVSPYPKPCPLNTSYGRVGSLKAKSLCCAYLLFFFKGCLCKWIKHKEMLSSRAVSFKAFVGNAPRSSGSTQRPFFFWIGR